MGALVGTVLSAGAQDFGPNRNEVAKLLASDAAGGDVLGTSVAISGSTALIGAPYVGDNGALSGAAYVFVRAGNGVWIQQAKLLASDGAFGDMFGLFVALSGDTAVIGSPLDDDRGPDSGSAYVFVRAAGGTWSQQAKLIANDGAAADNFGRSVAISGDTIVSGAWFDGDSGALSGSAYVFVRDRSGMWKRQAKLLASDGEAGDLFGFSVALSDDTALVGSRRDDDACPTDPNCNSGSAYVFVRNRQGVWNQQAKLTASDQETSNEFGFAVGLAENTALVGAFIDNDNGFNSGSAYVFTRDAGSGTWTQSSKLLPSDGAAGDEFGWSVAVDCGTAVVGALDNVNNAKNTGAAYVFSQDNGGIWAQQNKLLASDGDLNDFFGQAVAISGRTVVAGSPNDDDACFGNTACDSGSAYVFVLTPPPGMAIGPCRKR